MEQKKTGKIDAVKTAIVRGIPKSFAKAI